MTGFGEAHRQQDGLAVVLEVRAINNRFFKFSVRTGEGYAALEPQIEAVVRKTIRRGTIQVTLRVDRVRSPEDFRINADVLDRYRLQLQSLLRQWNLSDPVSVEALLALPGVVDEDSGSMADAAADWPEAPDGTSEYVIAWRSLNGWGSWDELLNEEFFAHAPDNLTRDNRMGFYDNPGSTGIANEDSGAGQIMDDFRDDTDEKEEWVRRYGNLFDHRTTAFRFVVAGIVYLDKDAAPTQDDVIADVRLEVDVDLGTDVDGDGKPDVQIVHMRYLSGQ